jgi:hypothetical protein
MLSCIPTEFDRISSVCYLRDSMKVGWMMPPPFIQLSQPLSKASPYANATCIYMQKSIAKMYKLDIFTLVLKYNPIQNPTILALKI